ncbi:MAG: phosphatidylserine decarboxylase family protein [Pseudomonadota bacterium]
MNRFEWADMPGQTAFPIARPGYPFIGAAVFVTLVFAIVGLKVLALVALLVCVGICGFFRDPDRVVPVDAAAVVSPADGRVLSVERITDARFFDGPCVKISIFMSVFNVHVNRVPFSGRVENVVYHPGSFFSANLDKAAASNEHNAVKISIDNGDTIWFVQIAGLIARRIISGLQVGHEVIKGQRFGMICFGSRLDLYLPERYRVDVRVGQKVQAGTTIVGFVS